MIFYTQRYKLYKTINWFLILSTSTFLQFQNEIWRNFFKCFKSIDRIVDRIIWLLTECFIHVNLLLCCSYLVDFKIETKSNFWLMDVHRLLSTTKNSNVFQWIVSSFLYCLQHWTVHISKTLRMYFQRPKNVYFFRLS